jgi:hypothetical protein
LIPGWSLLLFLRLLIPWSMVLLGRYCLFFFSPVAIYGFSFSYLACYCFFTSVSALAICGLPL